ncbi:NACHT domain-containing protein [Lentzea sp. CA-135723]|uniref:NACHT domain-containing protein n=1 Tax=Lentzea sp. CA-135723 TaxID=3239950 RepID=UPI003D8C0898
MTAIATVVADLAETALTWASNTPMSQALRDRIAAYLHGPDCASLFELLCQLEHTEEGKFHQTAERSELAEAFRREFQRAVRRETQQSADFAASLWEVIEQNAPFRTVDARDRIRIKVTGPDRPIAERLGLALDAGRRAESRATGEVIRAAMAGKYDRVVMPHSKSDFRFRVDQIYVPRTLLLGDDPAAEDEVRDRRFVVVGNPGAGKSTFIRRILRRAELVPLLVQLKQHQKLADDFVTIITRELGPVTQRAESRRHVADLLDAGEALVVFDGLDEVGDVQARRSAVAAIEAFAARFPLARIVVTCRQESYPVAPLDAVTFPAYRLPDFNPVQVARYVRTWFTLVHAESRIDGFLHDSEHLNDLRSNPLMLSLLCMLYQSEGYIPENTADVYRECSELMLVRWDAISQVPSVIRSVKLAKFLVQELAQHFFFDLEGQGDESEKTLERLVVAHLREREDEGAQSYHQQAREFLDYCAERAWVLTQVDTSVDGERRFGFTHRTFMEYYTACHVLRTCSTPEKIVERLLPMILTYQSQVVPQIALQMYDMNQVDGADTCVRLFLAHGREFLTVTTFLVNFMVHNNLLRSTTEELLEAAFAVLGRTGDTLLHRSLSEVLQVRPARVERVAQAVLARTAVEPGTDLRWGAGKMVADPSVAFEVALGDVRHGNVTLSAFAEEYGVKPLMYARLPPLPGYVPGPAVKAWADGAQKISVFSYLLERWEEVLPIPASVVPGIARLRDVSPDWYEPEVDVFGAMVEAIPADPDPELASRLAERCGDSRRLSRFGNCWSGGGGERWRSSTPLGEDRRRGPSLRDAESCRDRGRMC